MDFEISNTKEAFEILVTYNTIGHALTHNIIAICIVWCHRNKFSFHARRISNYIQVAQSGILPSLFRCEWFEIRM